MTIGPRNGSDWRFAGSARLASGPQQAGDPGVPDDAAPATQPLSKSVQDQTAGAAGGATDALSGTGDAGPDWGFAAQALGGDRELLHVVVTGCREELPKLRQALAEALRRGDRTDARRLALLIDESIRPFRAVRLSQLARRLARSAETASADRHALFAELVATLEHFLKQLPIPA